MLLLKVEVNPHNPPPKKGVGLDWVSQLHNYTPVPLEGGYTVLHLSVLPSVTRYFSSHYSQQLLMAEI